MMLLASLLVLALASAEDNIENVEKAEKVLKTNENVEKAEKVLRTLIESTGLDLDTSFRCGMFFPDPKDVTKLPISPLLIFNATWEAKECPNPDTAKHNLFCDKLFNQFSKTLSLKDPSLRPKSREQGFSIGDDICRFLKEKVKTPFVGKRSKKFPKGLEIGMFSSACGSKAKWHFTGTTHGEKVCCQAGKYRPEECI